MHISYSSIFFAAILWVGCTACSGDASNTGTTTENQTIEPIADLSETATTNTPPYYVTVEEDFTMALGLHSYALGFYEDNYFIVGGRTNGFHGTGGGESTFPRSLANDSIRIVNTTTKKTTSVAIPAAYRAALSSTNMAFEQVDNYLICVGGYGTTCANGDTTAGCYQTFPRLTVIDMKKVLDAHNAKKTITADFIQHVEDPYFQVAGGELHEINDLFYLVFGQNYHTTYDAGRVGDYTEQIRTFQLAIKDGKPSISNKKAIKDPSGASGTASEFHRRDLNVVPVLRADGTLGIDVYGGVFNGSDEAYQQPISINGTTTKVHPDSLLQGLYECGHVLLFDPATGNMYTTLMGGIGSHYYNNGKLVPDDLPFTRTVNTVTHHADGHISEYIQPADQRLPDFIGANAIFVPAPAITRTTQLPGIIDLSKVPTGDGPHLLGQMVGGIVSGGPQSAESGGSEADNSVYNVYLNWRK